MSRLVGGRQLKGVIAIRRHRSFTEVLAYDFGQVDFDRVKIGFIRDAVRDKGGGGRTLPPSRLWVLLDSVCRALSMQEMPEVAILECLVSK